MSTTTSLRKKSIVDTAAKHVRLRLQDFKKKRRSSVTSDLISSGTSSPRTPTSPCIKLFYEGVDSSEITTLEKERFTKTGCFSPSKCAVKKLL
eukprot:gene5930-9760_t